jgi:hypothetical protein
MKKRMRGTSGPVNLSQHLSRPLAAIPRAGKMGQSKTHNLRMTTSEHQAYASWSTFDVIAGMCGEKASFSPRI